MNRSANVTGLEERCMKAVEEAANWRLVALLLQRPHAGWWRETEALSAEVDHPGLKEVVAGSRDAAEGGYLRVFGPGGTVSPREIAYRQKDDPGKVMADIAGIYRAFSFQPMDEDPVDHICVEANFAGYLCLKEAYALAEGKLEAAEIVSGGLDKFLLDHVQPFARELSGRLDDAESGYLARSVHWLLDLTRRQTGVQTAGNI